MAEQGTLTPEQAQAMMGRIPGWTLNVGAINRTYTLESFRAAIAFVNRIADLAEGMQHHPEITISHHNVHLTIATHSLGGLTPKDFDLAERIDQAEMRRAA